MTGDVSAELRLRRAQLGLSLAQLAELLGLSEPDTLRAWESGHRTPRDTEGVLLAVRVLDEITAELAAWAADIVADRPDGDRVLTTFRTDADIRAAWPDTTPDRLLLGRDWHQAMTRQAILLADRPVDGVRWWRPDLPATGDVISVPVAEHIVWDLGYGQPGGADGREALRRALRRAVAADPSDVDAGMLGDIVYRLDPDHRIVPLTDA